MNQLLRTVDAKPLEDEHVLVQKSLRRILSQDIASHLNIPAYDRSWLDGYAVKSGDTKEASKDKPVMLKVVGKVFPEDYPVATQVTEGQAVSLSCGGPIPKGADAVIKVESTELWKEKIKVTHPVERGNGVIKPGEDIKKGVFI
ncbi:MAG: hypothetical protein ABIH76_03265 [Candidatus Bathyarchaeota archaeon]